VSDRLTITTEQLLAFLQCPAAGVAGMELPVPVHPYDQAADALRTWPTQRSALRVLFPRWERVYDWMAATEFARLHNMRLRLHEELSAIPSRGEWIGWQGIARLGKTVELLFEVPYALRVDTGLWDVVALDTALDPPPPLRRALLVLWGSILTTAFAHVTGDRARFRLLAPGYEREEVLELYDEGLLKALLMIPVLQAAPYRRPGQHCYLRRRSTWLCPLRRRDLCNPMGYYEPWHNLYGELARPARDGGHSGHTP